MTPILLLLHVLAFFLGADRIIVTGLQPNPGGDANVLVGQGWYWVTPTSRLAEVRFVAESSETGQLNWCEVKRTNSQWQSKLQIRAGDYDCWVELATKDTRGNVIICRTKPARLSVK